MDFRFSPEAEDLRGEVVSFLATAMSEADQHADPLDLTGLDEGFERSLHRAAGERGWLDLPPEMRAVFQYEVARAGAPLVDTAMTLAGAAVAAYGSDRQLATVYQEMRAGSVEICAALTEEQAGSDLTAIAATAVESDGGWRLSGRKVLVTGAHKSDYCLTVAVTDPGLPYRQSMSMFLVPVPGPGIEVVRRPTMNGWTLDEIVFHDAAVGADALLGTRGRGWAQMGQTLAAEASGLFYLGFARHVVDLLIDVVRRDSETNRSIDGVALERVAELSVELADAERLARRQVWHAARGEVVPGLSSMVKVAATEVLQTVADAAATIAGPAALVLPSGSTEPPGGGRLAWEYLERVHASIGAGANEVHRDGIAATALRSHRVGGK